MTCKLIKTEDEYEAALARIEQLMDAAVDTPEGDELELLSVLVERYEKEQYPIAPPDPIEAIKFRMDQMEMKQRDLVPYIGSKSKVSEVLNRRRPLTLSMMRALNKGLGIPADTLLHEPGRDFPEEAAGIDWTLFPLREMAGRGWIPDVAGLKDKAEEVMAAFVEAAGGMDAVPAPSMRQGITGRLNAKADPYAVAAWCMQVMVMAKGRSLDTVFNAKRITDSMLKDIVKLSYLTNGPLAAQDYLAKQGVHLIILPHLNKTFIDGAAMLLPDRTAVIALSLRFDRLDNFWFTLLHELVHLKLHVSEATPFIADDLEARVKLDGAGERREREADAKAARALIPEKYWAGLDCGAVDTGTVLGLAEKLKVSAAVIAGRVRYVRRNYRLLSNMVGCGEVRKLFGVESGRR